jgi:hypothetical protein
MEIDGTEVDEYGRATEAARAHEQMRRQYPTAEAKKQPRPPGAAPAYAIFRTKQGKEIRLSLNMPDEATAWINANYQLGPKGRRVSRR